MWNPDQYEHFVEERRHPFHDLLGLVEKRPRMRVVDLGCGTGELTRLLHDRLDAEETMGIDSSETMLLKSSAFGSEMLRFEQGDIEGFVTDRPFDLVFSNAALHWVPDHPSLFQRLTSFLTSSGQLAVQMPANDSHASHRIAANVAREMGIEPRAAHVMAPEEYATLLYHLGYRHRHVRLQIYGHLLTSTSEVVEWVKGALLTEYEKQLEPEQWETYLSTYTERLIEALGDERPYFYTYNRVLIWGSF